MNPANPANIAYASLFELRLSTDGGASFGPSILLRVPPSHGWCGDASLAFDSRGRNRCRDGAERPVLVAGSAQPWVLVHPSLPEVVYAVAEDDPDNNHAAGDAADSISLGASRAVAQ